MTIKQYGSILYFLKRYNYNHLFNLALGVKKLTCFNYTSLQFPLLSNTYCTYNKGLQYNAIDIFVILY